jgi:hypothetical protein
MSGNRNPLSGAENKRLHNVTAINSENNEDRVDKETNLKIRGEYRVEEAKNWVDNGSRL